MRKSILWSLIGAAIVAAAAVSVWLTVINAVPENKSTQSVRLFYEAKYRDSNFQFNWTDNAIAANSASDINAKFTCPATSTEVFAFLSLRGQEMNPDSGWQAFAISAFYGNTKQVLTPNLKPSGLISGSPGAKYSRDHGGDFSLGLACTRNQGKIVDSVSYRFISVEAHTGHWKALAEPVIKATN